MERTMKNDQEFKADGGKPKPTLLEKGCARAIAVVQATLDYGNIKYEAHSWKNVPGGMARYDDAARRHRNLRDQGEVGDVESWIHHLGHEIINNLFLLELMIENSAPTKDWTKFNPKPPQDHKLKGEVVKVKGYDLGEDDEDHLDAALRAGTVLL
jgi:hypothetical protein